MSKNNAVNVIFVCPQYDLEFILVIYLAILTRTIVIKILNMLFYKITYR